MSPSYNILIEKEGKQATYELKYTGRAKIDHSYQDPLLLASSDKIEPTNSFWKFIFC
jgi:hypothetical protein